MAKSPKPGSKRQDEIVEDSEAVEIKEETDLSPEENTGEDLAASQRDDSAEETVEDGVTTADEDTTPDEADATGPEPEPTDEETESEPTDIGTEEASVEEVDETPTSAPAPPPTERVVVEKRGGFVPMALGGVVAAALGYGAAWYQWQGAGDLVPELTAQGDRISLLETGAARVQEDLTSLAQGPDLSGFEAQISETGSALGLVTGRLDAIQAELTGGVAGLTERLGDIDARLTNLEQRPVVTGDGGAALAEEAIGAYEREVTALREEMQTQAARLTAMTEEAEAQLQAARDEIIAAEEVAAATARAAEARAALGRIIAAVDSGQPFAGALADLEATSEADIPDALRSAADEGVQTTRTLQDSFADAARAALSTARDEGLDETGGGVGGFLRTTFNARSVTPREGGDPDAVLSRVGAAVGEGRITDALAEVDTLPEVVRASMSDWLDAAQSRADALSALEDLGQFVNDN